MLGPRPAPRAAVRAPRRSGDECDTPYIATRRSLATFDSSYATTITSAFVDLVAEGGMVDWIHRTVVIDYPSACLGAPHNPHRGSLWLMQWHRPLLRFTEADQHVGRGAHAL